MNGLLPMLAIAGVLALLWLMLTGLRRLKGHAAAGGQLQVVQRVPLAQGCQLVAVKWEGQELLLAAGGQTCTVLARRPGSGAGAMERGKSEWVRS